MQNPMSYGKARGMLLAQKYFPDNFPFYDLSIIRTLAEWEQIRERYGQQMIHRVDYPLGHAHRNAVPGTSGSAHDIAWCLGQIQTQSSDGVLLIWRSHRPIVPRYQTFGGFNIGFSVNREVTIELAGLGFDGSDLTSGRALHEYYRIPWARMPRYYTGRSLLAQLSSEHYSIAGDAASYALSRERRLKLLTESCHYDAQIAHALVPVTHSAPETPVMIELFLRVIDPIISRPISLWREGLTEFSVQGNIPYYNPAGWGVDVWELFCPERWEASADH